MDRAEIIWAEGKRSIERQEASLDNIRTRSLALLSASGVIAALFAPRTFGRELGALQVGGLIAAFGAFAVTVGLGVLIQWPRKMAFALNLAWWFESKAPRTTVDADILLFRLSSKLWEAHEKNKTQVTRATTWLIGLCLTLPVQIAGWAVSLT